MAEQITKHKLERFLFDQHIFDDDAPDEDDQPEDLPPPPPTFSEAELEQAKAQAFKDGHQQGLTEARGERERLIAQILQGIEKQSALLFAAEAEREKIYERESLQLCLAVTQKLFPALSESFGLEELKSAIASILRTYDNQKQILIKVAPALVDEIAKSLSQISNGRDPSLFQVKGLESLDENACEILWEDGGAVRDATAVSAHIVKELQEVLAGPSAKGHDKSENDGQKAAAPSLVDEPVPAEDDKAEGEINE